MKVGDKRLRLAFTSYSIALIYEVLAGCMDMTPEGQIQYREQVVVFRKGEINHIARIKTYVDIKKGKQPKFVQLLTNDFDIFL